MTEEDFNIADDPLPHNVKARKRNDYKKITLYSAEKKKNIGVSIKVADFDTPELLAAYIDKLRSEQRTTNKIYKDKCAKEKIAAVLQRELPHNNPNIDLEVVMPVASDIDLHLDPNTGNTCCIYGASKRGKSTLMVHLYNKYFAAEGQSPFISTLFTGNPQLKVYKRPDGHTDKQLLISYGFNAKSSKYIQMQQYVNVKTNNRYKFLDMFDDIVDQKHAPVLNKLVLTYRNSNISSIICLQYIFMLSKQNRASVNHTCVFGSNTAEDTKNIIDTLLKSHLTAAGLKSYHEQLAFYVNATRDHGFIYLDNIKGTMQLCRLRPGASG